MQRRDRRGRQAGDGRSQAVRQCRLLGRQAGGVHDHARMRQARQQRELLRLVPDQPERLAHLMHEPRPRRAAPAVLEGREIGGRDLQLRGQARRVMPRSARKARTRAPNGVIAACAAAAGPRPRSPRCGWVAASTSGRRAGRLSHIGNSRRSRPPPAAPRPVMISTQRTPSAWAAARNARRARYACCAVRPCRSSVRAGAILPVRSRFQDAASSPPGAVPTASGGGRGAAGRGGPAAAGARGATAAVTAGRGGATRPGQGLHLSVANSAQSALSWAVRGSADRRRVIVHQHYVQPARAVRAKFQRRLDVGRARRTRHQHDVARHRRRCPRPRSRSQASS